MFFDQIDNRWAVGCNQGVGLPLLQTFTITLPDQVDSGDTLVDFSKTETAQAGDQLSGTNIIEKCRIVKDTGLFLYTFCIFIFCHLENGIFVVGSTGFICTHS